MMGETSRHFKVPLETRSVCLGADGSVVHVARVVRMIQGRWKLPILFRLFADPSMRTLQLKRDIPGISQKMLTHHLRELEDDRLVERTISGDRSLRVDYQLSEEGWKLLPVLLAIRGFSVDHPR